MVALATLALVFPNFRLWEAFASVQRLGLHLFTFMWSHHPPLPNHPHGFQNLFSSQLLHLPLPDTWAWRDVRFFGTINIWSETRDYVWSTPACAAQGLAFVEGPTAEPSWLRSSERNVCRRRYLRDFHGEQQKVYSCYLSALWVKDSASHCKGCFILFKPLP